MAKNAQVEMDGIDTELSDICDELIEARNALKEASANVQEVEQRFIHVMNDHGKKSVKHGGRQFRVSHKDAQDIVQVKNDA